MPLAQGTKLDSYEVLGLLGAGGMGEVYRARDPALKREVAIKVLPSFVSRDADRLHRFEQEAQAAASLNHPNILAVYQFGVFEGAPYLVSELLEGGTLRQVLQRGPLPIRKTIDYAVQIAHGLAAAHEQGIVHRDLKPENLFVTKDGRVKILDFGLAKLMQPQPESDGNAPTMTRNTDPGMVVGTAGYMSPEQVRGKSVDHRTDIFAFGAILYEMLSGTRAFHRSTSAETMTAILNDDPPAISQLVQSIPPGLQRVVHRCLEKNPEQRFHSASDLAFALEALSDSGTATPISVPAVGKRSRSKVLAVSIVAAAIFALTTVAYFVAIRKEKVPFEHYSIQKVIDSEYVRITAISPDGNYLAAVVRDANGAESLFLHHIPTNSERPIVQDAAYKYQDVIFSPDGSYIYFRVDALGPPNREDVYRIPVLGGKPTLVVAGVDSPLSFINGGQRLCFYRQDVPAGTYKFLSTSVDGDDERVLTNGKKPFPSSEVCSPSGRFSVTYDDLGKIETLDFASGSRHTLTSLTTPRWLSHLVWAPDGKGLFAVDRNMDVPTRQIDFLPYPGGNLRHITNDLSDYGGISLTADARTIATTQYERNARFAELSLADPSQVQEHQIGRLYWFTWVDNDKIVISNLGNDPRVVDLIKNETTTLNVAKGHYYVHPALCGPDTLVISGSVGGATTVYKMHLDGSEPTQLTRGPVDLFPECTADGKWLFYADNRDEGDPLLMRQSLQGGAAQKVIPSSVIHNISSDGKLLVTSALGNRSPLRIISTDSMQEIRSFPAATPDREATIAFSADNKSIFYATWTGADTTIWRQPVDGAVPVKVATLQGKYVYWLRPSPDGKKLGLTIGRSTFEAVLLHDLR
jgi:serine/threonine protein kinase